MESDVISSLSPISIIRIYSDFSLRSSEFFDFPHENKKYHENLSDFQKDFQSII